MPEYEFLKPDGTIGTQFMDVKDAPHFGAMVDVNGEKWTRIPSLPQALTQPEVRIECMSAPTYDQDVKAVGGTWNEHGEACFSSARQRDEYASRKGIVYDRR